LLREGGAMLLQAITIQDQDYRSALRSVNFIQRYVFPGSFIPSVSADRRFAPARDRPEDLPSRGHRPALRAHTGDMARNFFEQSAAGAQAGLPDSFIRLWEFYLCYCEGGFAERQLGDVQMLLTKPGCRRAVIAAL
jgi:cyclopropane-fatty-acyl-phospholipid synthase